MKLQKAITKRKKLLKQIEKLEDLAFRDQLTSLPNRHALVEDLKNLIKNKSRRKSDHYLGMLMLDIDWFKSINDEFSHLTGDKVLKRAAEIIDESISVSTFREGDKAYRIGGEEFVVLLPVISKEGLGIVAERIRQNIQNGLIKEFPSIKRKKSSITISIGGKTYSPSILRSSKQSVLQLFKKLITQPDKYLYEAKEAGRNCIVINGYCSA